MTKKKSLFSYSKKFKKKDNKPDEIIIKHLKAESKKGKILFITNSSETVIAEQLGFDVTVIDNDLNVIKEGKKNNSNINYQYSEFFNFSKRIKKDEFNLILDNSFSNLLLRSKLPKYYKEIGRILKYNGNMISKILSTDDPYCQKHCPKRHWTTIGDYHLNYFDKKQIYKILRKFGFSINKYEIIKNKNTYHLLNSTMKAMKL
jgi:hypothetical protein